MLRAGVGLSTESNSVQAAAEATAQALTQAGLRQADGVLVFATSSHGAQFPALVRTVSETAKTREVAGCSSTGVIASPREIESGHAVAVLAIGGGVAKLKRAFIPNLRGNSEQVAITLAEQMRGGLAKNNLLCLFPDTYNFEPDPFITKMERELPGVHQVGGGATEEGSVGETFQFCGDVVSSNSLSAMLIGGDLDITTGVSSACRPIGAMHQITRAQENVLLELDGQPAYEVFTEAIGPLAADLRRASAFVFVGVPLDPAVQRLEPGKFLVRNIIGASEEHGALVIAHRPNPGDRIGLVLRDAQGARENLKSCLEDLAERVPSPPAFALYFNCVSRGSGLYGVAEHDVAYIRQYLGEIPLIGFFSGLEIGPLASATRLLQYSGVLVLVSERQPAH